MPEFYRLAWKGFKWSYDEYGVPGALAFVAVVGVGYLLVRRRLDRLFEGEKQA